MADALDPNAVAALDTGVPGKPAADVVQVFAADLVKLRQDAGRLAEVERSTAGYVIGNELGNALASRADLVPGAAAKIAALIRGDFEAKRSGDGWEVASKDGRSVADVLAEYLAQPENAMFRRAPRSGAGANGATAAPTPERFGMPVNSRERLAREMLAAGGQGFGFNGLGTRKAFGGLGGSSGPGR